MNIGAIKCSAGLNLGNNFINAGGKYVMKTMFPNANREYFEFFDSCLPQWKSGVGILTPSTIDHIKNTIDTPLIVFAGSAGGDTMYHHFFKPLNDVGIPFIPVGIGCEGAYESTDRRAINAIWNLPYCVKMVTRDPKTYDMIEGNKDDVMSGIDLAFFAKHHYGDVKEQSDFRYAVVNYEPYGSLVLDIAFQLEAQLRDQFDAVYFTENTVQPSRNDIPNYVQIGYDKDLWRFYANASLVVTTRIHSCVCSVSNEVDFVYLGKHDVGGDKGRNTLFNSFGITLELNTLYESSKYQEQIEDRKSQYLHDLEVFL